MYPLVLSHNLVQSFKFWYQNEIHEGMCSDKEMYRLCTVYKAEDRQRAFSLAVSLAVSLAEHGAQVCITALRNEYKVWVGLRNLPAAALTSLEEAITV
ncbi:hypothetical protein NDA01_27535 [Trichocoleus desertorum AS-A10]|uniref:hypothetical protein n=1 Tax=Trichocoleus desertorum TaxID=1481672 RepID=UPI003298A9D5